MSNRESSDQRRTMKEKVSVTVDRPLVEFLDSLPGSSRSEKLERVLRRFREVSEDLALRRALAKHRERARSPGLTEGGPCGWG